MKKKLPAPGTKFEGGYFAGVIMVDGIKYALVVAPKKEGQHDDTPWNTSTDKVKDATSFNDGYKNTVAMAKAGSALGKWARDLKIGGFKDWYLPSQDELEICYRNLKPGTGNNAPWARSGINVSAVPPTYPYSTDPALQTKSKDFKADGNEAFDDVWHWTSTQHAGYEDFAWGQIFVTGLQDYYLKSYDSRARAVRRRRIGRRMSCNRELTDGSL